MANLTPISSWDDVTQLELTTPATGGPGGFMNRQAQALLNRTEKLKDRIEISVSVNTVQDLRNLNGVKDSMIAKTNGHTVAGTGGGTYRFESLSSKTDNDGAWIASNVASGTWVLVGDHVIEQWGVVDTGDQSVKIQKAIDFYLDNNIKHFAFEKSKTYSISAPIRFKQRSNDGSDSDNYADPRLGCEWDFNGAILKALTTNQKCVVISRDCVQINSFKATSDTTGVIGVYNGLDIENNDSTLRRSSMRMVLMNPSFDHIDVGMKFEPGETKFGKQWGSFYHNVINPIGTFVNIMYEFRQSQGAGDCSNTRNTFIGTKHIGGACTVFGEALESSVFLGLECEFINRPDSRLPNGEAVALYLPFGTPSDFQANRGNRFTGFNIEVCTNYINVDAPETHIDGFFQSASNPNVKAWIYNNGYDRISSTQGGLQLKAYNKTPRLGLSQVNDNGTSANLYIEGSDTIGNYKIVSDGRIEIPALSIGNARAIGGDIGFSDLTGAKNLAITFNSSIDFAYLAAANGIVGFTGTFAPALDNWSNIGGPNNRIKDTFLVNAPTVSSDIRFKEDIQDISETERAIALELKKQIKRYRLIDSSNEFHIGLIAQEVEATFEGFGLNAHDYKLLHYDEISDRYALVYEQLMLFIISAI